MLCVAHSKILLCRAFIVAQKRHQNNDLPGDYDSSSALFCSLLQLHLEGGGWLSIAWPAEKRGAFDRRSKMTAALLTVWLLNGVHQSWKLFSQTLDVFFQSFDRGQHISCCWTRICRFFFLSSRISWYKLWSCTEADPQRQDSWNGLDLQPARLKMCQALSCQLSSPTVLF